MRKKTTTGKRIRRRACFLVTFVGLVLLGMLLLTLTQMPKAEFNRHGFRASSTNLLSAIQGGRKEVEEAVAQGKAIVPSGLSCLEWSYAMYAWELNCDSVTELVYDDGEPHEVMRTDSDDWCRKRAGCPDSRLMIDAEKLGDFRPEEYGLIISTNVFEHLNHPEDSFNAMVRSMAPSGWLLMTVPFFEKNHGSPWDFQRFTYHRLWVFARDSNLCIHQIDGLNYINNDVYTVSYMLAQKQPCTEPGHIASDPRFTKLAARTGYALGSSDTKNNI